MATQLYQFLADIGYHHPLHPALTHLPVGLTMGSFLFILLGCLFRRQDFAQTAHHCALLAILAAVPTAVLGYMDWQHFYAGATLEPIKIKLGLAGLLLLLLLATVVLGTRHARPNGSRLLLHLLCLVCVTGLGFYGGELVYGSKSVTASPSTARAASVTAGADLFLRRCSLCHFPDRSDKKIGPGLKGIFQRSTMRSSGWPMSVESVRKQLKTPYKEMPAFDDLTEEQVAALIDYLKSL